MTLAALREHPVVRMGLLVADKYQRDNVGGLAASLAYFAIFSIFPLLLGVMSLVGFVVDPAEYNVQEVLAALVGSVEVRDLITQTLDHFSQNRVNAGLLGFITLLFAATGIFGSLNRAIKEIWDARLIVEGGNIKLAVTRMATERLIAFGLLLMCAGLVLAAVLGNLALNLALAYTDWLPMNGLTLQLGKLALTVALLAVAFGVLYKVLPRPHPTWGDVWFAALLAAVAFTILQQLAELIFGRINFAAFGVLGGTMTLLLWIYLGAQVLLVGVEVSYAWAHVLGSRAGERAGGASAD